jgi:uncharacterized protein (TIGR00297 family)
MYSFSFSPSFALVIFLIIAFGAVSFFLKKLTGIASIIGVITAAVIYLGAGLPGVMMLAVFFVLGTAATYHQGNYKNAIRLADAHGSKRNTGQVLANAGVAGLLALLNIATGYTQPVLLVMVAASLASATGDTLSSELGNVYGKNFYNVLSFKKDERGLNGVIIVEGTLFGVIGSLAIATVHAVAYDLNFAFVVIIVSGIAGNLSDSLLGASFERKGYMGNNAVNFLNTAIAAVVALLLSA